MVNLRTVDAEPHIRVTALLLSLFKALQGLTLLLNRRLLVVKLRKDFLPQVIYSESIGIISTPPVPCGTGADGITVDEL
jgi:hypothetical protein